MQMQTATGDYLVQMFGVQPAFKGGGGYSALPLYLTHRFELVDGELFNRIVIFAFDKRGTRLTPFEIKSSLDAISKKMNKPVIYCTNALMNIELQRLIAYRVQFIVPGKQAYLPEFLIHISNRGQSIQLERERFTPVAHLTFLCMMHGTTQDFLIGEIAHKLGYTSMSISRALDELEQMKLVERFNKGRVRVARLIEDKKTVWEKGKRYLRNPIESVEYFTPSVNAGKGGLYLSGITALSKYSMLADDEKMTCACSKSKLERMRKSNLYRFVDFPEDSELKLEIWKYDPGLFASEGTVDRLSIYAALKDDPDERIQIALDEMMEGFKW